MSARNARLPRLGVRSAHTVRPGRRRLKVAKCAKSDGRRHPTPSNQRTTGFCRARVGSQTGPLTPWTGCSGKIGTERCTPPYSRKIAEAPPILCRRMRLGLVASLVEAGEGADAGLRRLTVRCGAEVWRAVVDADGRIVEEKWDFLPAVKHPM